MTTRAHLQDIDLTIRSLTGESDRSRPFLCTGSPIGCEVAEVGINPAVNTPFWPFWSTASGCNKEGWLQDYEKSGRRKPTRDRIEVLVRNLDPLRLLELNLYHRISPRLEDLEKDHRDPALFNYLLTTCKPKVLLVHGQKPTTHLEKLFGVQLPRGKFTSVVYQGGSLEVFRAERHFAYVSRDYVVSVAQEIKAHLARQFRP